MKNLPKIGILLAAIVIFANTISRAGAGDLQHTAKVKQAQQQSSASTHSSDNAFLFAVEHPTESGINFGEQLPGSQLAEHSPHSKDLYAWSTLAIQRYGKGYYCLFRTRYRKLTLKKLIFPFHSHW